MNFNIHRGTQEIGGSCVEVWTETSRIVIDFGMPLVGTNQTSFDSRAVEKQTRGELRQSGILPDIDGLYNGDASLIISHAHQDHYGFVNNIHRDCSVYLGEATHELINITKTVLRKNWNIQNPHYFKSGIPFNIGDIEITPFLMDHSAFDAYGFLVKAHGQLLFYSGDFRAHGRKTGALYHLEKQIKESVDYLLLEGTTIGRNDHLSLTETEIENKFVKSLNEDLGLHLIYTSGQNIDRLVSIYRACKRTGKILAIDFYIANILMDMAEFASLPYPSKMFSEIKVFYPSRLARNIKEEDKQKLMYRFKSFKITRGEIDEQHKDVVMIVRPSMQNELELMTNLNGGMFTYSLWSGYKEDGKTKQFLDYLKERGMHQQTIHTSGHADRKALKQMVDILKPKNLVPIHTFEGEKYESIFTESHILRISDGETVKCEGSIE